MAPYADLLDKAQRTPDLVLLEFYGFRTTAAQLAAEAKRFAAALAKLGVQPGDTVGVMLPNLPQFVAAHFGTLLRGCIFVPFNVLLTPQEIEYQARDSGVRVMITYELFAEKLQQAASKLEHPPKIFTVCHNQHVPPTYDELLATVSNAEADAFEPVPVADDQVIMILYTSGTTGRSKGAQITAGNLEAMLQMLSQCFVLAPGDKYLCVLPLFHVYALNAVMHPTLRQGATLLIHPRFEVDACMSALENGGVTMFSGVPTMYFYLLNHPRAATAKFPTLRWCLTGGAAMPAQVLEAFERRFGVEVYEGYGLTETTVCVSVNHEGNRRIGSIGPPFEGLDMRVVSAEGAIDYEQPLPHGQLGEIVVRGPIVMRGYLNRPEETAEALRNGWFHTGDLGYRDADGFFYIVDRKKDMILKAGFNIYPREIEEIIYRRPEVNEAAVIRVPDEAKGEEVAAVYAVKAGQSLSVETLAAHLAENLARYKLPRYYAQISELPKGATGKILKREIEHLWPQLESVDLRRDKCDL